MPPPEHYPNGKTPFAYHSANAPGGGEDKNIKNFDTYVTYRYNKLSNIKGVQK